MNARNYEALYKLSRSLHHLDRQFITERVLASISSLLGVARGCLLLLRDEQNISQVEALPADRNIPLTHWQTLLERGVLGYVYHSRRTVIIRSIQTDPRWLALDGLLKTGSAIGVQLSADKRRVGLGFFMHTQVDYFDLSRVALLEEITALAAVALTNAAIYEAAAQPAPVSRVIPNGSHIPLTPDPPPVIASQPHQDSESASRAATNTVQSPF